MERQRVMMEDAAKHLLRCQQRGQPATLESLAGVLGRSRRAVLKLVVRMQELGLLACADDALRLTADGQALAMQVLRAHRLWESYLADEAAMPLARVHDEAERAEHRLTASELDDLDDRLGHPRIDPHGDPIPTAAGRIERIPRAVLTDWPPHTLGRIVHLEDEPPIALSQILALGLRPGMLLEVTHRDAQRIVVSDGDNTYPLAPAIAASIHLAAVTEDETIRDAIRLVDLPDRTAAVVCGLDQALRGMVRRRLMDMGVTPGATIVPELRGAMGRTRAYRVRGTLIALRREQAREVWVRRTAVTDSTPAQD